MKRKIIKQGLGGYTIYLPKEWVEKKGLKSGEEVDIQDTDTELIIGSGVKIEKQIVIEISDTNRHDIKNIITHLYRKGYNKIEIKNIDTQTGLTIKETVKDLLLGFEITSYEKSSCILENISEPSDEKYEVLMRRVFLILKETHNIISDDLSTGTLKHLSDIQELRRQQDKYILFCRRTLVREQYRKNPLLEWELLTFLMHIEHKYYYLYEYLQKNKFKSDSQTNGLLKSLGEYLEMYYDSYFQKDIEKIHIINKVRNEFYFGKCFSAMEKSKGKKSVVISQIAEIFRLIQIGTSPVLGQSLDIGRY